jgi:hypothetical protein
MTETSSFQQIIPPRLYLKKEAELSSETLCFYYKTQKVDEVQGKKKL